jgi:hypothetical protein
MTTWAEKDEQQRSKHKVSERNRCLEMPISAKEKGVITESLRADVSCVTSYVLSSPVER